MKRLAETNPQLKGLNLDDLNTTAEELYSKNGQDINEAKASIKDRLSSFMGK